MDGIHPLELHPQCFERFGMTAATNERLGKNLQLFKRFGVSTATIPQKKLIRGSSTSSALIFPFAHDHVNCNKLVLNYKI